MFLVDDHTSNTSFLSGESKVNVGRFCRLFTPEYDENVQSIINEWWCRKKQRNRREIWVIRNLKEQRRRRSTSSWLAKNFVLFMQHIFHVPLYSYFLTFSDMNLNKRRRRCIEKKSPQESFLFWGCSLSFEEAHVLLILTESKNKKTLRTARLRRHPMTVIFFYIYSVIECPHPEKRTSFPFFKCLFALILSHVVSSWCSLYSTFFQDPLIPCPPTTTVLLSLNTKTSVSCYGQREGHSRGRSKHSSLESKQTWHKVINSIQE
jgi:hypothetical protein